MCAYAMTSAPPKAEKADFLTIFITGSELSAMKPCGCSGGQLGGFEKRAAILKSVPNSKRLIIDTGSLIQGDSEQDMIKFNIIVKALKLLDYDVLNLTGKDLKNARNVGVLDTISSFYNIITCQHTADVNIPAVFTRQFSLKNDVITIKIVSFDAKSQPIQTIKELFDKSSTKNLNMLIINQCEQADIDKIIQMNIVDCIICPPDSDEPSLLSEPDKMPLVFNTGRYGRYVSAVTVRTLKSSGKLQLDFSAIPVKEDLPQDKTLVELYKSYQKIVKNAGLLEKYPRFTLSNGLHYVGSASCKSCHTYEYEKWSTKAHADAYACLEKVGSDYDPECVICHVVGLEYESGFITPEKTAHLKDVGCENCHGPGSRHIDTEGREKTGEPISDCTDCHTPEQSTEYAANEQRYFDEIIHWREPNDACDVQLKESMDK